MWVGIHPLVPDCRDPLRVSKLRVQGVPNGSKSETNRVSGQGASDRRSWGIVGGSCEQQTERQQERASGDPHP